MPGPSGPLSTSTETRAASCSATRDDQRCRRRASTGQEIAPWGRTVSIWVRIARVPWA